MALAILQDDDGADPGVVEAREIKIVDSQGKARGRFGLPDEESDETIGFVLHDQSGRLRSVLSIGSETTMLLLRDSAGNEVNVTLSPKHGGILIVEGSSAEVLVGDEGIIIVDKASPGANADPSQESRSVGLTPGSVRFWRDGKKASVYGALGESNGLHLFDGDGELKTILTVKGAGSERKGFSMLGLGNPEDDAIVSLFAGFYRTNEGPAASVEIKNGNASLRLPQD